MSFVLGLTGSIGMGKSTTAQMFAELGVPVWDADKAVRQLYAPGQPAALAIAEHYPQVMEDGAVSRPRLRALIAEDPKVLNHIQTLVHPLVAKDRAAFLERATANVVLLDVPLLFETGLDAMCDGVVVVSVGPEVQKERVLARGEMTEAEFDLILSRQMPDAEKRTRARWVIETDTLEHAKAQVAAILSEIEASHA